MKARVRPHSIVYAWQVDVYNPDTKEWIEISTHNFLWYANWKAKRIAKYSSAVKRHKKDEFLDTLKGIRGNIYDDST